MITVDEIAKVFNVSSVTVSNALNNRKGVAPEKALKIKEYARKIGYQPSYLAKSLFNGQTNVIGMCLRNSPSHPRYGELISKMQNRFFELGFYLTEIVANPFDGTPETILRREKWALNFFVQIKAEAIILGPIHNTRFYELSDILPDNVPVIGMDSADPLPIAHLRTQVDEGCYKALRYLVDNGHRRIGYIGLNPFEEKNFSEHAMYQAYRTFIANNGLPFQSEWSVKITGPEIDFDINSNLCSLLESGTELPTAFICHNDTFAIAAIQILHQHGLKVPEDVSLIGCDDHPLAKLITPPLTTIGFNLNNYVDHLVDIVMKKIDRKRNGMSVNEVVTYHSPADLIIRQSVKKI